MEENIAVVVPTQQIQAIAEYLSVQPYSEVAQFFNMISGWPGVTQDQVDDLFPKPIEPTE
jgi:hypothetical protein